jgi:hypothetical protein
LLENYLTVGTIKVCNGVKEEVQGARRTEIHKIIFGKPEEKTV